MQAPFSTPPRLNVGPTLAVVVYGLTTLVALAIPIGHFAVRYAAETRYLEHIAGSSAEAVSRVVYRNPDLWQYLDHQYYDVMTETQERSDPVSQFLVSLDGQELFHVGQPVTGPVVVRRAAVSDGFSDVGYVVVKRSLGPLLAQSGTVALLSFIVAGLLIVVLKEIPLRLLTTAVDELQSSRETLRRLFGGFPDAVLLVPSGTDAVLDFNAAALRLLGCSAEKLRRSRLSELFFCDGDADLLATAFVVADMDPKGVALGMATARSGGGNEARVVLTAVDLGETGGQFRVLIARDVTERERALLALRESEERYRGFVENFQGIAFRGTMNFIPVFFHGAVEEITGYSETEFLAGNPSWDKVIHPEDRPPLVETGQRLQTVPGFSDEREYRIVRKGGGERYVHEIIQNLPGPSGRPEYVQGVILDVTERRRQEEKLRLSEERFRMIGLSAQDAIIMADHQGVITFWNRAADKMFGYREGDAMGMGLEAVIASERGEDDLPRSLRAHHEHYPDPDEAPVKVFEMAGLKQGGQRFPIELSLAGVRVDDHWHSVMVVRDISRRKKEFSMLRESEERFRRIFEESTDAVVLLDAESCDVIDTNPKAAELFRARAVELKTRGLPGYLAPEDFQRLRAKIGERPGDHVFQMDEHFTLAGAGAETIVSVTGRSIGLGGRDVIYCLFKDVTETVRLSENWRMSLQRLVEAEKMTFLGTMVSGFAHDINNPNQLIAVNLPLVRDLWEDAVRVFDERYAANPDFQVAGIPYAQARTIIPQSIGDMTTGSERIAGIISNLLAFAREDAPEHEDDVDVNGVVTDTVALLRHRIRKGTDRFTFRPTEDLPVCRGNRAQIERVIANILVNALEALPDRTHGIEVVTKYDDQAGRILVRVADEGTGIPEDIRERIREPFFTTKQGAGGTGLGLAISEVLVREHGGTLTIDSREGEGTTITVSLACIH